MSTALYLLTAGLFATSFFIRIEPAPFDLLVVGACVTIVAGGRRFVLHGTWLISLLLALFIVANIFPIMAGLVIDYTRAILYFIITAYLVVLFYVVAAIGFRYGERGAEAVLAGCAFAALLSAVIGIAAFSGKIPALDTLLFSGRAKAFFKDPNVFGPFVGLAFMWFIYKFDNCDRNSRRLLMISASAICSVGVLVSLSRGAWLGTGVSLIVYQALRMKIVGFYAYASQLALPVLAVFALGAVVSVSLINYSGADELFRSRLEAKNYDEDRFYVQRLALQDAASNPLGRGPGQSEVLFPDISRLGTSATHSLFIRLMFENGWFGALFFGAFMGLTGYVSWQFALGSSSSARIGAFIFAVLAGAFVQSFFIDTLHWRHLWIICGLAWGMHVYELRDDRSAHELHRRKALTGKAMW